MASCKDCIHYEFCCAGKSGLPDYVNCKYFKDRNRFVELPCRVGDKVFVINGFKEIEEFEVDYYIVEKNVISVGCVDDGEYEIETTFLTREEAEKALKERENSG